MYVVDYMQYIFTHTRTHTCVCVRARARAPVHVSVSVSVSVSVLCVFFVCVCNTIDVLNVHSMTYLQHSHLIAYAQTTANVTSSPRLDLAGNLAAVHSTQAPVTLAVIAGGTSVSGAVGFAYQVERVRHCMLALL